MDGQEPKCSNLNIHVRPDETCILLERFQACRQRLFSDLELSMLIGSLSIDKDHTVLAVKSVAVINSTKVIGESGQRVHCAALNFQGGPSDPLKD